VPAGVTFGMIGNRRDLGVLAAHRDIGEKQIEDAGAKTPGAFHRPDMLANAT